MSKARPILALTALLVAASLSAQTPSDLVARGVAAYTNLDFSAAAGLLSSALTGDRPERLSRPELVTALTHLGAAEALRGNQDAAVQAFERLVVADPRHRIDELVFPPEVTELFAAVRLRTRAIEIQPQRSDAAVETFTAWLYPSVYHGISVEMQRGDGRLVRRLYEGVIGDSLAVRWNGRDSTGARIQSGDYLIVVTSRNLQDQPVRMVHLALEVEVHQADTLLHPHPLADTLFLPERIDVGGGAEALVGGTIGGIAVALLPQVLAPRGELTATRFVVGGGVGLAGVLGFVLRRPRALPENAQRNAERRRDWNETRAYVIAENERRRQEFQLVVRVGTALTIDLRGR